MPSAALPSNERERISALRAHELLDTPPEEAFDALTSLATRLFDVPIALVSLVDEHRQWFKSNCGLPGVDSTSRDVAFCSHAIVHNGILEVQDATADPRFAENPLVTGPPGIRFYAGAPIIDAAGLALGTICLIDGRPRVLSALQREQLGMLADAVAGIVALRIRASELAADAAGAAHTGHADFELRREAIETFVASIVLLDQLSFCTPNDAPR